MNKQVKKKKCDYPFFENYFSENKKLEAIEHAEHCLSCLESAVRFESILFNNKKNSTITESPKHLSEDIILKMAEDFIYYEQNEETFLEKSKLAKHWNSLWNLEADFHLFNDVVHFLNNHVVKQVKEKIKTPEYLKAIISKRIEQEKKSIKENSIIIRIKNGLKLYLPSQNNLFPLTYASNAVPVRSMGLDSLTSNKHGALQFYSLEEKKQKLLYQVVQDGINTVMLTVKLQNFNPLPKVMNIRKDNRIIHSFSILEDFAYFPQLEPGDYQVELKNDKGLITKKIDINIIPD